MIDRRLNYGRHRVRALLEAARPYRSVVDLGAGHGDDLRSAQASLFGIESSPACQSELRAAGIEVHALDLERERLPLDDASIDVVIANQVLEHVKEVLWILHESAGCWRLAARW